MKNKEVVDAVLHLLVGGEFDMELNFVIQVNSVESAPSPPNDIITIFMVDTITTNDILTTFMVIIIKMQI